MVGNSSSYKGQFHRDIDIDIDSSHHGDQCKSVKADEAAILIVLRKFYTDFIRNMENVKLYSEYVYLQPLTSGIKLINPKIFNQFSSNFSSSLCRLFGRIRHTSFTMCTSGCLFGDKVVRA
jgi:hypothetical protein